MPTMAGPMTAPLPVPDPPRRRARGWLTTWSPILPLLIAEFVVWLGFGALLPVMPLYFTEHGVDFGTLGVVVAAWPAARLVGEPIFGWLADRTRRVPLMVVGNIGAGVFQFLPLVLVGPGAFIALRALQGLSTAIYDPAARGYITDATPPERRGEAFGLYGAAQMGGLLLGPAFGGIGAAAFGGISFVFVFGAVSSFVAAGAIALRVREMAPTGRHSSITALGSTEFPGGPRPIDDHRDRSGEAATAGTSAAPARLLNRLLIAAILLNIGGNFAAGTYDVIWSLWLSGLGAGVELIGFTFAMFGLPILLLSPMFGRRADRGGIFVFLLLGSLLPTVAGVLYTFLVDPITAVPLILVEATGFAMLNPVLFAIVAAGSPIGRSSTAQGLYGAAGTIGFVLASLLAGVLAEANIRLPFYAFAAVMMVCLLLSLAVGGRALAGVGRRQVPVPVTNPLARPGVHES
jgi:DHA1 family multidrug resistance protein-like MFS transporter